MKYNKENKQMKVIKQTKISEDSKLLDAVRGNGGKKGE